MLCRMERLGVAVLCNHVAEAHDVLAETPDIVIVATGGVPDLDGLEHATSVWDLLTGNAAVGEDVIVYDGTGRHPAPHGAEHAAMAGSQTILVSIDGELATELTYAERAVWKRRLYELDVRMTFDHRLTRIIRDGNRMTATFVNETTGTATTLMADQIIVEHGTLPLDKIYHDLRGHAANNGVTDLDTLIAIQPQPPGKRPGFDLHRIGDAVASRNIAAAIYDALRLCHVM